MRMSTQKVCGGTAVTAKVDDARTPEEQSCSAGSILRRAERPYECRGLTAFDDRADLSSKAEVEAERGRYAGRASSV